MPATISHSIRDMNNIEIVPVIASFDTEGHVKPLYVRIGQGSYKVDSAWVRNGFINSTTFHCNIIDNGTIKPLILTYHNQEEVWTTPNIPSD